LNYPLGYSKAVSSGINTIFLNCCKTIAAASISPQKLN
jgi:hypothetical protein